MKIAKLFALLLFLTSGGLAQSGVADTDIPQLQCRSSGEADSTAASACGVHESLISEVNPRKAIKDAHEAMENGSYQRAVELLERALQQDPNYLRARLNLAYAYYKVGRLEEAIEQWQAVLRSGDVKKRTGVRKKDVRINIKSTQHEMLLRARDNVFNAGQSYFDGKDWTDAAEAYRQCTEILPDMDENESCYYNLAASLANGHKHEEALALYQQLLANDTRDKKTAKKCKDDIADLEKQVELQKVNIAKAETKKARDREFDNALALLTAENYPAAETAYRQFLQKYPNDPAANFNLSLALQEQERWPEALAAMQAANADLPAGSAEAGKYQLELRHVTSVSLTLDALKEQSVGDYSNSESDYRKAIGNTEPGHGAGIYAHFADLLIDEGKFEEARQAYQEAQARAPKEQNDDFKQQMKYLHEKLEPTKSVAPVPIADGLDAHHLED